MYSWCYTASCSILAASSKIVSVMGCCHFGMPAFHGISSTPPSTTAALTIRPRRTPLPASKLRQALLGTICKILTQDQLHVQTVTRALSMSTLMVTSACSQTKHSRLEKDMPISHSRQNAQIVV